MDFEELEQKIEIQIEFIVTIGECVCNKLNELLTKIYGLYEYGFITITEYFRLFNYVDRTLTEYRNSHLPF